MGDFPEIGNATRRPVTITIPPHWADHHFQGRAILPAVEAMQLLAHWVQGIYPHLDVRTISQATFNKFMPLSGVNAAMNAFLETIDVDGGGVRASLITRTAAKTVNISRTMVHAQLDFGNISLKTSTCAHGYLMDMQSPSFKVDPSRIYTELVPFGLGYRNITKPLDLWPEGALAHIGTPDLTDRQTALPLGSPFVLDAALHAACVWSQRYAGVVAFPVGIGQRIIHQPTCSGDSYRAHVVLVKQARGHMAFDICITDLDGSRFEVMEAVRMRDVSGGRLKPPDWIGCGQTSKH